MQVSSGQERDLKATTDYRDVFGDVLVNFLGLPLADVESTVLRGYVPTSREGDTTELSEIAELTGGRFYRARDREGLEGIYAEIEELERTPRKEQRYEENFDLYPFWLWSAFGLYGLAWLCHSTWARRLP